MVLDDVLESIVLFLNLRDTYVLEQLHYGKQFNSVGKFEQLLARYVFNDDLDKLRKLKYDVLERNNAILTGGTIDRLAQDDCLEEDRDIDIWCDERDQHNVIVSLCDHFYEDMIHLDDDDSYIEDVIYAFTRAEHEHEFDQNKVPFQFGIVDIVGHKGQFREHPYWYMDLCDLRICRNYYDGRRLYLSPQFLSRTETIKSHFFSNSRGFERSWQRLVKYMHRNYIFEYGLDSTTLDPRFHSPIRATWYLFGLSPELGHPFVLYFFIHMIASHVRDSKKHETRTLKRFNELKNNVSKLAIKMLNDDVYFNDYRKRQKLLQVVQFCFR